MLRPPGFRVLLTLLFGLLSLAMTCVVAVGLSTFVKGRLGAEQQDVLQTLARSTGAMLAEGLYERMREVELLAAGPELRRARLDANLWRPLLARMQQTRPQFAWIGITDTDGMVRVATGGLLEQQNVSSRPWFTGAVQGSYVGDVHPAKLLAQKLPPAADGGPLRFVDFAAPLHDPQGRLIGVLGVHGSWDWAGEVVRTLRGERNRDRGILVYIVDDAGHVLHQPAGVATPEVLPPEVRMPTRHALVTWPDERDYLTAVARVPTRGAAASLGWTVIVRQPAEIAFETANQAARLAIAIGLTTGLLGLVGLWWLAGRISAPVVRITDAARAIEAGRLDFDVPDEARTRETFELAQSLRSMTTALLAQKAEVEAANRGLEQRVAERTAALEQASAELERLARHDTLTGLPNRRVADERLLAELALHRRHATPFGVLLIDIDHFKQVNDGHGHDVGDAVLIEVARRMAAVCRATDLLARWGGEEFIALVASTDAEGAHAAAEKLRAAVSGAPIGPLARVTVSIGLAPAAAGLAETPAALLKAADRALYEAKRRGRDRVVTAGAAPDYQCIDARSLA